MNYPKKRGAAGAIFFNEEGKVLLLEPTYKDDWEIPGGIIEDSESPKEACEREIKEELGLDISVGELLCLEYQREEDDSYMFIFDGGILSEDALTKIAIDTDEIQSFGFYDINEIENKVLRKMFLRIKKCIESKRDNNTQYYETIYK